MSTLSNSVLTFMNNRCPRGSRKNKSGVCIRNSARARARDEKAAYRQMRAIHSRKRCSNGSRKNSKGVCVRNSARARALNWKKQSNSGEAEWNENLPIPKKWSPRRTKRCPNGYNLNKKTRECDKKKMKREYASVR